MDKKDTNIVGTRIGLYDVLYECDFKSNDGHRMFHVKCSECGWESNVQMHRIKMLSKKCKHINLAGQYSTDKAKIIWNNKRIFKIYQGMIQRCYNPNNKNFKDYGEKGIGICKEWLNNPKSFEDWAISHGYKDDLTIDRINSNKNYCPDNCQWITLEENSRRASANFIEVDGKTLSGTQWAETLNFGQNTINKLIRKYPLNKVKELIRRRIKDPDKIRSYPKQSWMSVYGID